MPPKITIEPEYGTTRYRSGFLHMPLKIGRETRVGMMATWMELFHNGRWCPVQWCGDPPEGERLESIYTKKPNPNLTKIHLGDYGSRPLADGEAVCMIVVCMILIFAFIWAVN